MLKKMPLILLLLIVILSLSYHVIPLNIKEHLYAISLLIKSGIGMMLPFIIFSLLFKTMVNLATRATGIILIVLVGVCASNFISTHISHFVGQWVYGFDMCLMQPKEGLTGLGAAWSFAFPSLIPNSQAMFGGLVFGILGGWFWHKQSESLAVILEKIVQQFLNILMILIPIFICGYVLKMLHDGILSQIIHDYASILMIIAGAQFTYVGLLYFASASFDVSRALERIRNMLPAAFTGFSTMSSAAAMPLTIIATSKNTTNKDVAQAVIPATVNVHLIGDCFAIPIFAYAVMKNFGVAEPTFMAYLIFSGYFVLTKFSVAAIPGGGIIVMLPILEQYLGFNAEMMSLITALYILFDPVITSANVLGNGAFACIIDRLSRKDTVLV